MTRQGIAVVEMSLRAPGASNVSQFWNNLCHGVLSTAFMPLEVCARFGISDEIRLARNFVPAEGIPSEGFPFDHREFGMAPREAELMHPQRRTFLLCASEVFRAVSSHTPVHPLRTGVFVGYNPYGHTYSLLPLAPPRRAPAGHPGLHSALASLANLVSYKLNLTGPSIDIQSGSPSSLVAIHLGCENLLSREIDLAIAGGVSHRYPWERGYLYEEGSIFSSDGYCRSFDAKANGTVPGSGIGVVALMRVADALDAKLHVKAVIVGSAINNDGSEKVGYMAPSVKGQARVIMQALTVAEVEPRNIRYIEAHGTATVIGDPVEVAALKEAWRLAGSAPATDVCALGSVKSNIGHLDAAAGVIGFIKTVLALERKTLPASINFERPNPTLGLEGSPFYVNATSVPWTAGRGPRFAGINSYGLGGTNAHLILREFLKPKRARQELAAVPKAHVFISYVKEDIDAVDRLCRNLEARGIRIWRDRTSLSPGDRWKPVIERAIRGGSFFLACFSDNYHGRLSTYMNEELLLAVEELRKRPTNRTWFLPVLLSQCEIPERMIGAGETLRDLQAVSLFEDWAEGLRRIAEVILGSGQEIAR